VGCGQFAKEHADHEFVVIGYGTTMCCLGQKSMLPSVQYEAWPEAEIQGLTATAIPQAPTLGIAAQERAASITTLAQKARFRTLDEL
jgi:hypothetical protein